LARIIGRLAGRSRTPISPGKVEGGLQELEETVYWMELISEASIFSEERLLPLRQEAQELTAMFVTMVKNVKNKNSAGIAEMKRK